MSVDIKMDGLEQLRNKLKSFAKPEPIKKIALEKSGEHLRGVIQELAPVRKGSSGGALKASIVKSEVVDSKIFIGPSQQGPSFRAHFPEFGTSTQPAQPYIRPGFEQSKSTIEKIMAEEIRKGLGL